MQGCKNCPQSVKKNHALLLGKALRILSQRHGRTHFLEIYFLDSICPMQGPGYLLEVGICPKHIFEYLPKPGIQVSVQNQY